MVSDVVVAEARYHLKCYIQFTRKANCLKKTRKGSDPKDMYMHKIAHEEVVVSAKVVVQTLNETNDELEDVVSE